MSVKLFYYIFDKNVAKNLIFMYTCQKRQNRVISVTLILKPTHDKPPGNQKYLPSLPWIPKTGHPPNHMHHFTLISTKHIINQGAPFYPNLISNFHSLTSYLTKFHLIFSPCSSLAEHTQTHIHKIFLKIKDHLGARSSVLGIHKLIWVKLEASWVFSWSP